MATKEDYAALSAIVYNNVRKDENILSLPPNWELLPTEPDSSNNTVTGFTAAAYRNTATGEIVIAYKGTDTVSWVQTAQDFLFGNPAAIGGSVQLVQAALFYQQVKAGYGDNITFTGHSLGGGLASVMGVWFDKSASTFAQAPFEAAALNPIMIAEAYAALRANSYDDPDFLLFHPQDYAARQADITSYFVHGEVLSEELSLLPNVVGANNPIYIGGEQYVSSTDLHSMLLHAALVMPNKLLVDSLALPNLVAEIFDRGLYFRDPNSPQRDFLSTLLNDQIKLGYDNPDGLLTRFADDIHKLTQYGTNFKDGPLSEALIDVAIADYYVMQNGFTNNEFFTALSGGIGFDLSDIGANWSSNSTVNNLVDVIANHPDLAHLNIRSELGQSNYWTIQSGNSGLTATGTGNNNDAMIGGWLTDTLDGGTGNDVLFGDEGADSLIGGEGDDLIIGGKGNDTLDGGAGYDTYVIEGSDTIEDSDGKGSIKDKSGNVISGAIVKNGGGAYVFLSDPSIGVALGGDLTLTLSDGSVVVVENYEDGDLGISLFDNVVIPIITTNTIEGDHSPVLDQNGVAIHDSWSNIVPAGAEPGRADYIFDTSGNDLINAGGGDDLVEKIRSGNDIINLGAGDDEFLFFYEFQDIPPPSGYVIVNGGDGRDAITAGFENDIIEGDLGADGLTGQAGDDIIYGDLKGEASDFITQGATQAGTDERGEWVDASFGDDQVFTGAGNDLVAGGAGNDLIVTGGGDDAIYGDWDSQSALPQSKDGKTYTWKDWTFTDQGSGDNHEYVIEWIYTDTDAGKGSGNDTIYAGAGDDVAFGELGDDILNLEDGNDIGWGGEGSDSIFGGSGDDVIVGDEEGAIAGNNFLDGGDGSDQLFGGDGNDTLFGGSGNDTLSSGDGDNFLHGEDGDDTLIGGKGNDILLGGNGNDALYAGDGANYLDGGLGDDTLSASGGNNYLDGGDGKNQLVADGGSNTLFGGADEDNLSASGGSSYLDGGDGKNYLVADGGSNTLFGGADEDNLSASGGNSYLDGGDGKNHLVASGGNNTLFGGADEDRLSAGGGNNYLDGGDGNNTLIADGGSNALYGGSGDDIISSAGGFSDMDGGGGNDHLMADGGNNALYGGSGNNDLSAVGGHNYFLGGSGNDSISAGGGYSYLDGGDGKNTLSADGGNNSLHGGKGDDSLSASGGSNYLDGGDGNNILAADGGNNTLLGGTGDDTLWAVGGNNYLDGGDGNDILFADGLNNTLLGGAGKDELYGSTGYDILIGGEGDDLLFSAGGDDLLIGGSGRDTYVIGSGHASVIDSNSGNELALSSPATLTENGDLVTFTLDNGDSITVNRNNVDQVHTTGPSGSASVTHSIEGLLAGEGVTLNGSGIITIPAQPPLSGTEKNDTINSSSLGEILYGNGGDDVLKGNAGDDGLSGGTGYDLLFGGNGNDVLSGGAGYDELTGGDGDDVYLFNRGDGVDVIFESPTVEVNGQIPSGFDEVRFGVGIRPEDLQLSYESNDLHIKINGTDDELVIAGWMNGLATSASPVDSFVFTDPTVTDIDIMDSLVNTNGFSEGSGPYSLEGIFVNEVGTAGADVLFGLPHSDALDGAGGNDVLSGNNGDDVLIGGAGDDYLRGGNGSDTYVFEAGFGHDIIAAEKELGSSKPNTIKFGAGINAADVSYSPGVLGDLVLTVGGDSLIITGWSQAWKTYQFEFSDGSSLPPPQQILEAIGGHPYGVVNPGEVITGTSGDDYLITADRFDDDTFIGLAGDDVLVGGYGNDTLDGGSGDDYYAGSFYPGNSGADTYIFGLGYGQDIIQDMRNDDLSSVDRVKFTSGVTASEIVLVRDYDDLLVQIRGTNDQLTIENWFIDIGKQDMEFVFVDGSTLPDASAIIAALPNNSIGTEADDTLYAPSDQLDGVLLGLGGNDQLYAGNGNDRLDGGAGDDTLYGGGGDSLLVGGDGDDQLFGGSNDVLDGGAGNDSLYAGHGHETYIFGIGYGHDTINNFTVYDQYPGLFGDSKDKLVITGGVTADDVTITRVGDDLVIDLNNGADAMTVQNWFVGPAYQIDSIEFANGEVLTPLQVDAMFGIAGAAPQVQAALANQVAVEDAVFVFHLPENTFTDADTSVLALSATQADGSPLPAWLYFDADSGTFYGVPTNGDVGTLQVAVSAGDGSNKASDVFTLTVNNVNDAPTVAQPVANQNAASGAAFNFQIPATAFADVDAGDTLTYSAVGMGGAALPAWLTFDAATGTFSGTPQTSDIGNVQVSVIATDVQGASVSSTFIVAVAEGAVVIEPHAPTINLPITNQTATEDAAFTFQVPAGTFVDVDAGDNLTLSATLADGTPLPSWISFNATNGTFSGTPVNGDVGAINIKVTATDSSNLSTSSTFTVTTQNTNDAPIVSTPIVNQTATEDAVFSFQVPAGTFADVDAGDNLTLSAMLANGSVLPSWISFDAASGTFSGTPVNSDVGILNIKVTAADGSGAIASSIFTVTTQNTNDAPIVSTSIANQTATEDAVFSFHVPAGTFTDVDASDGLTLSATLANGSVLPSWLSFDAVTGTFSGTPLNGDVGSISINVTATDNSGATASSAFSVTTQNTNDAPIVSTSIVNQTATEDAVFSFQVPAGTFADVDAGDSLTLSATLADGSALPSWLSFDPASGTFRGTPVNSDVGMFNIKVTATDGSGATASSTFAVTTQNTNDAPVVSIPIANQTIAANSAFTLAVAGSFSDIDVGDTLTYSLASADGSALPSWLSYNAATGVIVGTPGVTEVGTLNLLVTATDAGGASATQPFVININTPAGAVLGTAGNDSYAGTLVNDVYYGGAGNDTINGAGGNDTLLGQAGNDTINGGAGSDTMYGGTGNDTYVVDNSGDIVVELLNGGTDIVQSSITFTLGSNVENLTLQGASAINGTGNELNNSLIGNSANNILTGGAGNDVLNGGAGSDSMIGGSGDDSYVVDVAGDVVNEKTDEGIDTVNSVITYTLGNNVENLVLTGTAAINGTGNALNNLLTGNSGNNILTGGAGDDALIGGAGTDTLRGGTGNDVYEVDVATDVVTENANEGTDTVNSFVTLTLAANVENLTLLGNSNNNATGNVLNNVFVGNSGDNTLNGGAGADNMSGGAGNDVYVVDSTADVVSESVNEGSDTVQSSVTYTLGANLEALTLSGTSAINGTGNTLDNILLGNGANNVLIGGAGNDTLNGGAGNDTLVGGNGNDVYVVDAIGDAISENANEGIDLVQTSVTHTLGNNVENLTLTGAAAINGIGNALDNVLMGNSAANILTGGAGNDTLNGGAGSDTLRGGTGDDMYLVDSTGDAVTENFSEGIDTVSSSISYTLGANVENLVLTGTAAINGTGNSLSNTITGNSASNILTGGSRNDVLNGGAGADTLRGGTGNDLYVIDNAADVITENVNEGIDTVLSSIMHTLAANVENLTLIGTSAVNGAGNSLNNTLIGNVANNFLTAGSGNDVIIGGGGNDSVNGGSGNDTYQFGRGDNVDTVNQNDSGSTNDNALFGQDIARDQLWFVHSGNDLQVSIIGTGDQMVLNNWYLGSQYHVDQFKTNTGDILLDAQVDALVSAMAAFSPPPPGQLTLTPEQHSALDGVLAANWS